MVKNATVQKAAISLYGGNDEKRQRWTRSAENCWVMATRMTVKGGKGAWEDLSICGTNIFASMAQ